MLQWFSLFLVGLAHLHNEVGDHFTLACIRLNRPLTGLSILCIIDSLHDVFDLQVEQHKFVGESQEDKKTTINTRGSVRLIYTKSKA